MYDKGKPDLDCFH